MALTSLATAASGEDTAECISYHAVCLYREDTHTLTRGQWLNDNIITFWAECMTHMLFYGEERLLFMHPSAVFMMRFEEPDELRSSLSGLRLHTRTHIFAPINDNEDATAVRGGTHWSLLVYEPATGEAVHLDSVAGSANASVAARVATLLHTLAHTRAHTAGVADEASAAKPKTALKFSSPACPQQKNSSDCGVYALIFQEEIAEAISEGQSLAKALLRVCRGTIGAADADAYRSRIQEVVEGMRRE